MKWLIRFRKQPEILEKDQEQRYPKNAYKPKIILSLDRSWVNWIGLSWFTYMRMIRRAGGIPLRVSYGTGPEPENINRIAEQIMRGGDALLLSGGGDVDPTLYGSDLPAKGIKPRRDRFESALIHIALRDNKPILAICRGCQLLNITLGGALQIFRDDPKKRKFHNRLRPHSVTILSDSHLAYMVQAEQLGAIRSLHGQAVSQPGDGLRIVAFAEDGIPEAYESISFQNGKWIVGVQWHPELMPFKNQEHRIFNHFVQSALHNK